VIAHGYKRHRPRHTLSGREQIEVDLITNLIESYYGIVRDKVIDSVPKAGAASLTRQQYLKQQHNQ
jgi:replication fork clamp-binding protein CrfC